MLIRAGYEISFDCFQPTPMMFMLSVHPERLPDLRTPQEIQVRPQVPIRHYQDGFGNICSRLVAPPGRLVLSTEFIVEDSGEPDAVVPDARQHAIEELPDDCLVYLLGSRYCDTDRLHQEAWSRFGGTEPGWSRVQAIVDYVHERIRFSYPHADSCRTATSAHSEQIGVCRDFAHLAIALCRCMNIPARYCTGYLGDIGVPPVPDPMDFSAWFEVYLGNRWHTFDARHNKPRIGRILIARGRDATDVAISTSFGQTVLAGFSVVTEELPRWMSAAAQ